MKRAFAVLLLLAALPARASPPASTIEASASVPAAHDGCLDHTVVELGMGAKRVAGQRTWNIEPRWLHPSIVAGGSFQVQIESGPATSTVRLVATWPGAAKEPEAQSALEQRLTALADRMSATCGGRPRSGECRFTPAGGAARSCTPAR